MGFTLAQCVVEIGADLKGLDSGLGAALTKVRGAVNVMNSVAGMLGLSLGVAGVTAGMYSAVQAASALGESISKTKYTFENSFTTINRVVDELATKYGLVRTVALDAAANLGLVTQATGMTKQKSAEVSAELLKLAADAASFFNVSMEDALSRIQSGLVGEAEPMRRFGVLLSEDAVKAEALRMKLITTSGAMTEQAKVAARVSLIMKGMATVSGDLERTQSSTANQMRRLGGEWENLKADFGKGLTAPLVDSIALMKELVETAKKLPFLKDVGGDTAGEMVGNFFGGLVNGVRGMNKAGQMEIERFRKMAPGGGILGGIRDLAAYVRGAEVQAIAPDQAIQDRAAGVQVGKQTGKSPLQIEMEKQMLAGKKFTDAEMIAAGLKPKTAADMAKSFVDTFKASYSDALKTVRTDKGRETAETLKSILSSQMGRAASMLGLTSTDRAERLAGEAALSGPGGKMLRGASEMFGRVYERSRPFGAMPEQFTPEHFEGGMDLWRRAADASLMTSAKNTTKDQAAQLEAVKTNTAAIVTKLGEVGDVFKTGLKNLVPTYK